MYRVSHMLRTVIFVNIQSFMLLYYIRRFGTLQLYRMQSRAVQGELFGSEH
jgi:hypothetical protein